MKHILFYIVFLISFCVTKGQNTLRIPVVVHVVASSELQDVSDTQINSQIDVLNEDFNAINSDLAHVISEFQANVGSANIQFFLTRIDENGFSHSGITRTTTSHGPFGNDDIYKESEGGTDAWDSDKFLNIWVCDLTFGIDGLSGFPGAQSFKDGVVVDYESFGLLGSAIEPTNLGRTATHEIGHWLGLAHTWGSGGCASDDGISDTPIQSSSSNCDLTSNSCETLEMAQNFMNTGADSCLLFFTQGQCDSMRSVLSTTRASIVDYGFLATFDEVKKLSKLSVFPNPCDSKGININVKEGYFQIRVFNHLGILRFENLLHAENGSIFVPTLALEEGMYYMQLQQNDKVHMAHFVKANTQ